MKNYFIVFFLSTLPLISVKNYHLEGSRNSDPRVANINSKSIKGKNIENKDDVFIPRINSDERNTLALTLANAGLMYYDIDLASFVYWDGYDWIILKKYLARTPDSLINIGSSVRRIDHVGLNITNLMQSANWYKKVFGFKIINKWTTTWMIGNDKIRIGLFERPKAAKISNLDSTIAITHFALLTDSIRFKKIQITLKNLGIPFATPEDTGLMYSIFIYDPDGHQIEITTYYKDSPKL